MVTRWIQENLPCQIHRLLMRKLVNRLSKEKIKESVWKQTYENGDNDEEKMFYESNKMLALN
jgi:hypothetical protein